MTSIINFDDWVNNNRSSFLPPVCNQILHPRQLKIMAVGGPNKRKDFHLEVADEVFYQIQGNMCLRVVENGKFQDIIIRQGEIFLLPGRTFHSPQREANTLGLVIERQRLPNELDCLRFMASEEFRTGKPTATSIPSPRPYDAKSLMLDRPLNLLDWIDEYKTDLRQHGSKRLFDSPMYQTDIIVFADGVHKLAPQRGEIFVWQLIGFGEVAFGDESCLRLSRVNDTVSIPENTPHFNGIKWHELKFGQIVRSEHREKERDHQTGDL